MMHDGLHSSEDSAFARRADESYRCADGALPRWGNTQ